MRRARSLTGSWAALVCAALVTACSAGSDAIDGGALDAAPPPVSDARPGDADPVDAVPLDADPIDADSVDAAPIDAGFAEDALLLTDAAAPDATPAPDAEPPLAIEMGQGQTAYLNQALTPVVIRALLPSQAPLAGAPIRVTAPPGAVARPTRAVTDAQGRASIALRVGLLPGPYAFDVGVGTATVTVHATAIEPPRGTIFTLVNATRRTGTFTASTSPGSLTPLVHPDGVARDGDGTLYFSDRGDGMCSVFALSPAGVVSRIAGTGVCYDSTSFPRAGVALSTRLGHPTGLAVDVARRRLYIAESGGQFIRHNSYVRMLHLDTGLLEVVAGGGPHRQSGPQWPVAVDRPAVPTGVSFADGTGAMDLWTAPDGRLFIQDYGRIHVLAPSLASMIWWSQPQTLFTASTTSLTYEGHEGAWGGARLDSQGQPVVAGLLNEQPPQFAIARGVPGSFVGLVGGGSSGADGPAGQQFVGYVASTAIALDVADNIFYTDQRYHRLRRVDAVTEQVTTLAGQGRPGFAGDYGPASAALIASPAMLLVTPDDHVVFVDSGNAALRVIW